MAEVETKLGEIKQATSLPVGVGFGIKDAQSASKVAMIADAVVVGSAIIKQIEAHANDQGTMLKNIKSLLSEMRDAMDNATQAPGDKEVA